jgi:hypothetical protein
LNRREVWGVSAQADQLEKLFANHLEIGGFINVAPLNFNHTLSNNRVGNDGVHKRLDRFIVHHKVLN